MRALVTGASGFVGQWLCRALLRDGWTVDGVALDGEPRGGTLTPAERKSVRWTALDLSEPFGGGVEVRTRTGVRREVAITEADRMDRDPATEVELAVARLFDPAPDAVFHLSGIAFQADVGDAFDRAMAVNVGGANVLERAVHRTVMRDLGDPVLLLVGSGEQYGRQAASDLPLVESAKCAPATPYGLTKWMQESIILNRYRMPAPFRPKERIIATRSFNHSGPGQSPQFFLPGLVARVKAAPPGGTVPIGNTGVVRDFLHVEDVVAAYISLVARGTPGEVYNVCSGEGVRIGDLANEVIAAAGSTATLQVDPALQRAVDVPALVGDNTKLRQATGWTPRKTRSDIIADLLASLDAAS